MRWLLPAFACLLLVACSTPPAPVVDRSQDRHRGQLTSAGKYRVRSGDTLYAIAFSYGLDYRDVARWNGIRPPYTIFPGQELALKPPPRTTAAAAPAATPKPAASSPATRPRSADRTAEPVPAVPAATALQWQWPTEGRIVRSFKDNDPARNGLEIGGRVGQPVLASAGGVVVYSGNGLLGYGELIIIKHDQRMLTAYAHNRVRLVQEGAQVRGGQKIAEMGRNEANQSLLHFEIRRDGRPVNPLAFLPNK
ncbi:MAG: peptidoglycan DD-metalloendopeptidase family protein [Xanthomonadales bacterium]|nr:peptidoglycan DD-metalloendopeptidase family protein [Xanthomonadales bacterium]NIN59130.1 peptidoglycan DD-metalloendopeptidase family protein [Xanthomonadales bacterium]NIN74441.1 peptidoglycan DD-metalloendopeptidase family protein [Xanthomonadales bacterium]NIO13244.1 peptidoglycan DD-metalloendopeptidase family protein [Xanthomonadales bacterium]NIP11523.1 peptidoglycan DD-metalloendopeptidase family protein [Xanthomonadales bacterium]